MAKSSSTRHEINKRVLLRLGVGICSLLNLVAGTKIQSPDKDLSSAGDTGTHRSTHGRTCWKGPPAPSQPGAFENKRPQR